jgi:hypothetical protein
MQNLRKVPFLLTALTVPSLLLAQPTFTFGKYKGREIDQSSRRSIHITEQFGAQYSVDNFYHDGKFWHATIDVSGVRKVIGQQFNFSMTGRAPINHVQARFLMDLDKGIQLRAADGSAGPIIHDFVSSVEATGPVGIGFNFKDALLGNLVNSHRFLSTDQVVNDRILLEAEVLQQVEIKLTDEERTAGLIKLLEDSDAAGHTQTYWLFRLGFRSANCTSTKFDALDAIVHYRTPLTWLAANTLGQLPLNGALYLRLRGVLGDSLPTLNAEFAEAILAGQYGTARANRFRRLFTPEGVKIRTKSCPWLVGSKG